ncbi:unconventional prefoldin RPB5 interactor 1 [Spea bombifrons]|uniref:unconventional prefoldin RPB5 interactor 1 n=1 Tax=Spea bombifrons TaxID=233779 RepID=UPI002348F8DE|nr:unconventional prefoldin RPB5 interactor 1 [Spea bombifrons]
MEDKTGNKKQLSHKEVSRLQEEQGRVVSGCQEKIQHWKKVESDYDALQKRLHTLPDKLSYEVMVPFGPLAFMPGRLVQTNEITVLLGDNWFAKCSAKEASALVDHRKKHVRKALDDLQEVLRNFESRVEFTKDLQRMSGEDGDYFDIREEAGAETVVTKGKQRTAHKPHSKPKIADALDADLHAGERVLDNAELWARLEELEKEEELQGELNETEETFRVKSDLCSEEDKENRKTDLNVEVKDSHTQGKLTKAERVLSSHHINSSTAHHSDDDEDPGSCKNAVATIHFQHTVEPKRVRINTGKNTTLKYSEKKEEAKRKRKNSSGNGHAAPELPVIKTPADIYRAFVDLVNGEYVPRKSIMKSRSRENSVCSDTSESSAPEFEERRSYQRNCSFDESPFSDHGDSTQDRDDRGQKKLSPVFGPLEAFSGTVVEKEPFSFSVPVTSIAHPALPTIPERNSEEPSCDTPAENTKRVSKFKATRIQQKK